MTADSGQFSKNKNKGQSLSHEDKMKELSVFDQRRKGRRVMVTDFGSRRTCLREEGCFSGWLTDRNGEEQTLEG